MLVNLKEKDDGILLFPPIPEFGVDHKSTIELYEWTEAPTRESYSFDEEPETESGSDDPKMLFARSVTRPRGLKWSAYEDNLLMQAVWEIGHNWIKVAKSVGKVKADPDKCRARY